MRTQPDDPRITDLDRVRAFAEGTMPAVERPAFEARLAAEADLASLAAAYRITAPPADDAPAECALPFEALSLDAPPAALRPLWLRPAAAVAATVLLGVGIAAWYAFGRGPSQDGIEPVATGPVALARIPLSPVTVPILPDVPPALADYRPTDEKGLRFVEDLATARVMSRASSRPLLAFVHHPNCPDCIRYMQGPFLDPAVRAAAAPFVLAKANVMDRASRELLEPVDVGWPVFLLFTEGEDGERRVDAFGDYHDVPEFVRLLEAAARKVPPPSKRLAWEDVNRLTRDLLAADAETDVARRTAAWTKIASEDPEGGLGEQARARLAKQRDEARLALLAARDAATASASASGSMAGPPAALRALDEALPRFAGTPYETDLRRVRERVARGGAFPDLTPPPEIPR